RRARSGLRRELVVVDQPAEHVTAADAIKIDHLRNLLLVAERRPLPERPVRPMLLEMPDVGHKHAVEVAPTEDQQSVGALAAEAADPALGVGARLWRARTDPDAFGAEELVEL